MDRVIKRGAPPPYPRVTFVLAKVTKTVLPRKASPASQVPSLLVGLRRCAYGMSLCRMRTRGHPARAPLGSTSALPRGSACLRGRRSNGVEPRKQLGPVWRARASQAFARKPEGARGEGPRASLASTRMCCRATVRQRREAQGEVAPSGVAFSFVHFFWPRKRNGPGVGGGAPRK